MFYIQLNRRTVSFTQNPDALPCRPGSFPYRRVRQRGEIESRAVIGQSSIRMAGSKAWAPVGAVRGGIVAATKSLEQHGDWISSYSSAWRWLGLNGVTE